MKRLEKNLKRETSSEAKSIRPRTGFNEEDRNHALTVIRACGGSLTKASERLGISIPTLSRWNRAV